MHTHIYTGSKKKSFMVEIVRKSNNKTKSTLTKPLCEMLILVYKNNNIKFVCTPTCVYVCV